MGRYTSVHANPNGAGDARPTALQIILDEGLTGKLTGKVIVMTGVSAGIGLETARALATTGATLYLTTRSMEKAQTRLASILSPNRVSLIQMDNTSLSSVRTAAASILELSKNQVNILINNAGVMGLPDKTLTEDGLETHFATNHLSHFLLFQLLKPALLASATPAFHSRVVLVASSAHRAAVLPESNDYNFEHTEYNWSQAYSRSKLENVYMANELDRRYAQRYLRATSLHPGGIDSEVSRHVGEGFLKQILADEAFVRILKSAEQGAATTVVAAVGREWEGKGGRYLEDCEEAERGVDDDNGLSRGYVRQSYEPESEGRLWRDSLRMVGLEDDV